MENEDKVEPDYVKGFNEGYIISQYLPELTDQLAIVEGDSIRLSGIRAGREQYQAEQLRERLPSWLKSDRLSKGQNTPAKSKDRGVEPDKD